MQTSLTYRTNRDLFSNHYLDEHLPETEEWDEISDKELESAYEDIKDLWEREKATAPKRNESQLEEKFIRPMFRSLGIPFEVEESTSRTQRRPDYGFFDTQDAARNAFDRREEGGDFYENSVAVADAKRWGRPLDTRGSGEHERDFENPSYQIHVYLQETPVRWAVLTDGKKWRLYYGPTSHRLDSYYEVDLPTILEKGDLEDFKYFYLFFRHEAFLEDAGGDSFLDDVYDESNVFAQELGEDLQDNIYEAIKILSEGFMQYSDNDLEEDDLDLVHDSSLIYLYRVIFVLYAEAEGRDLLNTDNGIYEQSYSLNSLKQEVAEEIDSDNPKYRDWQENLWDRLDELFKLIDQGSKSRGIPEEDLYIPAYNGGLFRTDPDQDDSPEARFLAEYKAGDAYVAKVIELLTRSKNGNGGGKIFVDYSSLDVRHLGSIYEGLLEYQLDVANEPLALEDGEYVPASEGGKVVVEEGEVHLSTGSGERKTTGSYYTPEYIVEYIVEETLGPLVDDVRSSFVGQSAFDEGGFAEEFAEGVFDLKILDPAMGSGHFLTSAIDYLAREIIDAQERQAAQQGIETVDEEHDINWARRQVAQRCIYGVDLNPLAVELAKVSLWLRTLAAEQPLAFLDHHLKTGNSLVGSDIEEIEELESDAGGDGQNATLADFGVARKGTIEQLMRIYQDFIAIENQDLADVKEMEAKYDEFERNKLRQRLEAMTNVHTAEEFGLRNLPSDAYKLMASALEDDDEWGEIEEMQWFQDAQEMATENDYFHWKLEYPEVFYDQDGGQVENPGFDAVLGNPPYIRQEQLGAIKDYLANNYGVYHGVGDIFIYFIEKGKNLLKKNGRFGNIVSNKFVRANYAEDLREFLTENVDLNEIIDFGDRPVFPDADAYPLILLFNNTETNTQQPKVARVEDLEFTSLAERVESVGYKTNDDGLERSGWSLARKSVLKATATIENDSTRLEDYIDGQIHYGIKTGYNEAFFIDSDTRQKLIEQDSSSEEVIKPLATGSDIRRYYLRNSDDYIVFTRQGIEIDDYPAIKDYLAQYKTELEPRPDDHEGDWEGRKAGDYVWYEIQDKVDYWREFNKIKIIYPVIAKEPRFAMDTGSYHSNDKTFIIPRDDYTLLGILNSKLTKFWVKAELSGLRGGYQEFRSVHIKEFPVATGATRLEDSIAENAKKLGELHKERSQLNLNILDYLGDYVEGNSLSEMPSYQPAAGVHDTVLSKTKDNLDSLRVGTVSVSDTGGKISIEMTARYKPEEEEEYETDQWGYTETDPIIVAEFVGLDDMKKTLIEEFVPVAVSEANGFANFREKATNSKSLLDRFSALTLPKIESVDSQLQQYLRRKEHDASLKSEIETLEREVNNQVYQLYELGDEEISAIEESVDYRNL